VFTQSVSIRLALIAVLFTTAVSLSACGRRGGLEAPEGSTYPKAYPADYGPKDENDKNN
jgi:predicted small lipoprotein YifL